MKKNIPNVLLCLSLVTLLSFDVAAEVELTSYLNTKENPSFLKYTKNAQTLLNENTSSVVLEVKKFPSGNSGIKLRINKGKRSGETYWVYYNKENPGIKLVDKNLKEVTPELINEAYTFKATMTRDIQASRDLEEQAVIETAREAIDILDPKKIQESTTAKNNSDCPPEEKLSKEKPSEELIAVITEENYKETDLIEPFRETVRTMDNHYPSCGTIKGQPWETCKFKGAVEEFNLTNSGPNKIITANEYYINRSFQFQFEDRARSEIKLLVVDAPDGTTSHATYSVMLFFPRSILPSIKQVGDQLHVTLPNKEIVKYDAKTKQIVGGVFTEGKMVQAENKKAIPAAIKYTGEGVMIRADKSGDLPYGDIEVRGTRAPSITTATVSKKGFKDCKIPSKDIWYTDYAKKSVLIKPEFATDSGLDSFIKKRCGFSIF